MTTQTEKKAKKKKSGDEWWVGKATLQCVNDNTNREKKKINCESMIVATTQAKINFFFVQNKIKKRSTMR